MTDLKKRRLFSAWRLKIALSRHTGTKPIIWLANPESFAETILFNENFKCIFDLKLNLLIHTAS